MALYPITEPVTAEQASERDYIVRALEYAPIEGPAAADLLGFWTPAGWFLCSLCSARMTARGCAIPKGSAPAWKDQPFGVCVGCESDVTEGTDEPQLCPICQEGELREPGALYCGSRSCRNEIRALMRDQS